MKVLTIRVFLVFLILLVSLLVPPPKPQQASTTLEQTSPLAEQVDEFIKGLVAEDKFSGVVLVARDGTPIFKRAYGLASKEFNVPNRLDTKFNLVSMTKMFTGVAIARMRRGDVNRRVRSNNSIQWTRYAWH